ncbi:hypothetical protein JCM3765_001408 [Sporobolomyces pararoseus]
MPVRRIIFPSTSSTSIASPLKVSTSHLGTAFELVTLDLLSTHPYYMNLIRVGGANDKGVDLRGRWNLSNLTSPLTLPSLGSPSTRNSRSLDVIVQCKAERTSLRPSVLREFEGVLQNQSHQNSTTKPLPLGILVSLNGFSTQTINRSVESRWPLSLVHLRVERERLRLDGNGKLRKWEKGEGFGEGEETAGRQVVSWSRNQAWKEVVGEYTSSG